MSTSIRTFFAVAMGVLALPFAAEGKTPGQRHCHGDICYRVLTLDETVAEIGRLHVVQSSYYDDPEVDRFNPRRETSSGEMFDADAPNNAASPIWPDGTILLVRLPATGKTALVRINNAGPYHSNRLLDVSRALGEELGFAAQGVAQLETVVVYAPNDTESRYKRNRRYEPVAGMIGSFASIDEAMMSVGGGVPIRPQPGEPSRELLMASLQPSTSQLAARVSSRRSPRVVLKTAAASRAVQSQAADQGWVERTLNSSLR